MGKVERPRCEGKGPGPSCSSRQLEQVAPQYLRCISLASLPWPKETGAASAHARLRGSQEGCSFLVFQTLAVLVQLAGERKRGENSIRSQSPRRASPNLFFC